LPAEVTITSVEATSDADLEALVDVRRRSAPDLTPTVENLRFQLESKTKLAYVLARLDGKPVACGYVEGWTPFAIGDVTVVPEHRRRGIGAVLLANVSKRARSFGNDTIQAEIRESDEESRGFLERRGFVQVGAEKAMVLDLEGLDPPAVDPPAGIRIVSRVEEPDLLEQMYAVGVQADEDIPGSEGVQTFEQWRSHEIDRPTRRPELCFIALAGDEVVGYAALQVVAEQAEHGLTATRRDWRRRGVASALKRAEIAAAKRAGFKRLITESEERNEPMRRLNEKLGFVPSPELSMAVMRGPLA
jgi:ribosomal protein S18 acetylase RimI-like enzyme